MHKNKRKKRLLAVAFMGAGIIYALPAAAAGAASTQMKIGSRTSQPIGHYEYCRKHARDCDLVSAHNSPVKLSRKRWNEMVAVNAHANSSVTPVTDKEYYGVEELWTYPELYGDCEDYVLMKRRALMDKGWPASSLLVTVVRQTNGDGHAVLTVRTDRADYVLDNLSDTILPWNQSEYTFLKRQSAAHSGQWEDIIDSRKLVGAVR